MAINFPDSPTAGDVFNVGDKTWTWDGSTWNVVSSAGSDHGNLAGLGDDDHTQYALADGTRGTFEASGAVSTHEAASDPHTQYLLADGSRTATELTVSGDLIVDTDTLVADSTNNRVGIGTASPEDSLHIKGNAQVLELEGTDHVYVGFYPDGHSAGRKAYVGFGGTDPHFYITNQDTGNLYVSSGSSSVSLLSNGNIGINDTTPSYTLDVNGTVRATSGFVGNASTASALATARTISLTGDVTGSTTFNGSANVSISATVGDNSHNHTGFTGLSINSNNGGSPFYVTRGGGTAETFGMYVLDRDGFIFMTQDETSGASYIHIDNNGASGSTRRTYFNCNIHVPSVVKSGTSNFQIEHPLPEMSESHWLIHTGIEGPNADNLYRGTVTLVDGTASVNLDTEARMTEGTFVALNRRVQCFTTNETDWGAVKGSVDGNVLTITAQDITSTATVSWMVIGERKDQSIYDSDRSDPDGRALVEIEQDDPSVAPRTFEQAKAEQLNSAL